MRTKILAVVAAAALMAPTFASAHAGGPAPGHWRPPAAGAPPAATRAAAPAAPKVDKDIELKFEKATDLSDQEKVEKAREHIDRMRSVLSEVLKKLEEARDSKDVIKLNCVNEKLTQVKGLLKISENADIALEEAVAKRESDTAEHEYTKIVIARQKVDQLRTEAEECIGEVVIGLDDDTIVEVEEPEGLPETDPTTDPPLPPTVVRPPPASPIE